MEKKITSNTKNQYTIPGATKLLENNAGAQKSISGIQNIYDSSSPEVRKQIEDRFSNLLTKQTDSMLNKPVTQNNPEWFKPGMSTYEISQQKRIPGIVKPVQPVSQAQQNIQGNGFNYPKPGTTTPGIVDPGTTTPGIGAQGGVGGTHGFQVPGEKVQTFGEYDFILNPDNTISEKSLPDISAKTGIPEGELSLALENANLMIKNNQISSQAELQKYFNDIADSKRGLLDKKSMFNNSEELSAEYGGMINYQQELEWMIKTGTDKYGNLLDQNKIRQYQQELNNVEGRIKNFEETIGERLEFSDKGKYLTGLTGLENKIKDLETQKERINEDKNIAGERLKKSIQDNLDQLSKFHGLFKLGGWFNISEGVSKESRDLIERIEKIQYQYDTKNEDINLETTRMLEDINKQIERGSQELNFNIEKIKKESLLDIVRIENNIGLSSEASTLALQTMKAKNNQFMFGAIDSFYNTIQNSVKALTARDNALLELKTKEQAYNINTYNMMMDNEAFLLKSSSTDTLLSMYENGNINQETFNQLVKSIKNIGFEELSQYFNVNNSDYALYNQLIDNGYTSTQAIEEVVRQSNGRLYKLTKEQLEEIKQNRDYSLKQKDLLLDKYKFTETQRQNEIKNKLEIDKLEETRKQNKIKNKLEEDKLKLEKIKELKKNEKEKQAEENAKQYAKNIMNPLSGAKFISVKAEDKPYVLAELNKLKEIAYGNGDTIGVMLASAGGNKVPETSVQSMKKAFTVVNQLSSLSNLIGEKNPDLKDEKGNKIDISPLTGWVRSKNPWDTNAKTIEANVISMIPNLARGIYGEVGVLTNADVELYKQTLPNLKQTDDVKKAVLGMTLGVILESIKDNMEIEAGNNNNVSGLVKQYSTVLNKLNEIEKGLGIKEEDLWQNRNKKYFLEKNGYIVDEQIKNNIGDKFKLSNILKNTFNPQQNSGITESKRYQAYSKYQK